MSYDVFELPDGTPCHTGNLAFASKPPPLFSTLADSIAVLRKDDIAKILSRPNRKPARDRFTPQTWVKNQGRRGSCNAYAATSATERARDFRRLSRVVLGPEFLYAQINGGRDRGSRLKNGMQAMEQIGCPPKDMVQYESYTKRQQSQEAYDNAGRFRILEPYEINSEDELATALALNFMCVVACQAGRAWMKLDGDGVVHESNGPGNHAICVHDVRIKNGEYQFDHVGSWGLNYGDQGHGWTTWSRHYRETHRYHQFYAIRSTLDDPQGDGIK